METVIRIKKSFPSLAEIIKFCRRFVSFHNDGKRDSEESHVGSLVPQSVGRSAGVPLCDASAAVDPGTTRKRFPSRGV